MSSCGAVPKGGARKRRGGEEDVPDAIVDSVGGRRSRRRKVSKKKTRRSRFRGGDGYGFNGPIGTNGPEWGSSYTSQPYSSSTSAPIADPFSTRGGRRRKSKKAGRKSRKGRRMRGGVSLTNPGMVGYGFSGTTEGVRGGIAPASVYASKVPMGHAQGADGVMRV